MIERPDFSNLGLGNLGFMVSLTHEASSFGNHIVDIVPIGSNPKVIRSNAKSVVASVKNARKAHSPQVSSSKAQISEKPKLPRKPNSEAAIMKATEKPVYSSKRQKPASVHGGNEQRYAQNAKHQMRFIQEKKVKED